MPAGTSKLLACAAVALLLHERARRILLCWLEDGMQELAWRRLPRKIIFIRHGEAQHNLEGAAILQEDNPNRCLLYTSPSPRDRQKSRMPSSA